MKVFFTLLFFFQITAASCQTSVQVLANFQKGLEIIDPYAYRVVYFKQNPTWFYGLGFSKQKKQVIFSLNALHLNKEFAQKVLKQEQGSHGDIIRTDIYTGNANLRYLSFQFGFGYIIKPQFFQLYLGVVLQEDFLYHHREYGGNMLSVFDEKLGLPDIYVEKPNYEIVRHAPKTTFSVGPRIGLRFNIAKKFALETGFSMGVMETARYYYNWDGFYSGVDFKVHYFINKKN